MSMTIDEIVRKIRKSQNGNVHTISAKEAYELADCIEKAIEVERIEWRKMLKEAKDAIVVLEQKCDAVEQCQTEDATCQESLQVGNAAKMRAALEAVYECAKDCVLTIREGAFEKVLEALSSPPRNVDCFNTPDEALSAYSEDKGITQPLPLWYGNEFWAFIHWLFANAKGGEKLA